MLRFLLDECLSPTLEQIAHLSGFEAAHVGRRGLAGRPDWTLVDFCVNHDWVMVTNNARDFRPLYSDVPLHPGLAIILPSVSRPLQKTLFELLLKRLSGERDITNKLVEISSLGVVTISDWPSEPPT